MFIKDECINWVDSDRDFSAVEEELKLAPVVALAPIVFSVGESVHADVSWEVSAEDFSDEESVVECTSNVLDGVWEVEGLNPFEDFTRESCSGCVGGSHSDGCCHLIVSLKWLFE